MKKLFFFITVFYIFSFKSQATQWMSSFEDAQKMAIATNKLILIDFWADWCMPCKRMDSDTWSKPEIQELMNNYIPLKIDIDRDRKMSNKYSVNIIPYVIIVDSNGEIIYNEKGYKDKDKMLDVLKKYSIDTSIFQEDLVSFFKNENANASLNIAEKYMDFSVFVDESVKYDFLKLADLYLKKTKKLSEKRIYEEKYSQKVHLLGGVYKNLIKGKYDKALKSLDENFSESSISIANKPLFEFLYFTTYNKLEDKENAKLWFSKLKEEKDFKIYLLKSRKI